MKKKAAAPVTVTLNGVEALNYIAYRDVARDLLVAANHAKPLVLAKQEAEKALLGINSGDDDTAWRHGVSALVKAREAAQDAEELLSRGQVRFRAVLQAMTETIAPPNKAG